MYCQEIMSREVQWIAPDVSVAHAAELMAFHNLGFLPICNAEGRPLGVITDRDIALRVTGKNLPAAETKIEEVMTTSLHTINLECQVADAGELLAEAGISRLLVVNDAGILEGIFSMTDLIMHGHGHTALKTARGVYARETKNRPGGHPHPASEPTVEFFHRARDFTTVEESNGANPARAEAEDVNSGRNNDFREFPT